jgi:mono/diheme cytochrome c family protein
MRSRAGGVAARSPWTRPGVRAHAAACAIAAWGALFVAPELSASVDAEGCTDLDGVPVQYVIDYQSAIQGIFDDNCIACHSGDKPPAGLDLGAGGSWSHLVNVPSSQDPSFTRVIPNDPTRSLLFLKINCDTPGVGHRMPFGLEPLSDDDQALVLDWIAGGAPPTTTDGLFRSGFEQRG